MARHLIHKQTVNITIPHKEQAFALQSQVSTLLRDDLPGKIEDILDTVCPPDTIMRLDKVQLNLGVLTMQTFADDFQTRFIHQLKESLVKPAISHDDQFETGNSMTTSRSMIKTLTYFLEKGYLPWYSAIETKDEWENDILSNLSTSDYRYLVNFLTENYRENPVVIERLILQFSDNFLNGLFTELAYGTDEGWKEIFADFITIIQSLSDFHFDDTQTKTVVPGKKTTKTNDASSALLIRNKLYKVAFKKILENDTRNLTADILLLLTVQFKISQWSLTAANRTNISSKLNTSTAKRAFQKIADKQNSAEIKVPQPNEIHDQTDPNTQGSAKQKEPTGAEQKLKKINENPPSETNEIISSGTCGIVLLHPFIKPYFEKNGLIKDDQFISDEATERGVMLLHYLATGSNETAEFELVLQKILCGFPLEKPLPGRIVLTDQEIAEAEGLLQAVINYWEPMRNTSVEGLRQSFLLRKGNIEPKENGWLLRVEQKTLDILLGKLPWGFSTIRMPWMKQILNVDWY